MGQLLATFLKGDKKAAIELFLDFEDAKPTAEEAYTHAQIEALLKDADAMLNSLKEYEGATALIKQAIEKPDMEAQAWEKLCPLIKQLEQIHDFSEQLANIAWPAALRLLCSSGLPTQETLDQHQATTKQLGLILHFALAADEEKMSNPAIQNDFSYYRRTVSKKRMSMGKAANISMSDTKANQMSLFYAYSNPFLKSLLDSAQRCIEKGELPLENVVECFSVIAAVCQSMVDSPEMISRFRREDTHALCLRVMTGSIVIYDHLSASGAFGKKSTVDIRNCVRLLKDSSTQSENLINTLKYSTKHLNDPDTPKAIKALLD